MKKTLIAAGVLGVFAMGAHAQSSVTLYGSLDAGIVYANNVAGHSAWIQNSGSVSNTYFGLRGAEDLGGGLKAIFTLESGFNLNNGGYHGETGFNRKAYVGLQSNQFGTLTLGRQYDSVVDYLSPLSAAGMGFGNNLAGHPFDNDNLAQSFSIKNAVKYESVNYAGFKFGGLYGFSNDPEGFSNGRAWSAGASYNYGPLNVAAAYLQLNNSGALGSAQGAASSDTNISARLQRTYGVGATYAFGPALVGLVWTHSQIDGLASLSSGGAASGATNGLGGLNLHTNNYEVNGAYHLTPALALLGSYTFTDGRVTGSSYGRNDPKWHTVMLATDYSFSKRTDVYLAGVYQHASGSLGYDATGNGISNVAAINTLPASTNGNQVAATVGLRHRF
ncbi:porin [Paraburkholderia caballeronis]|uniref:Outer membrane protein (Porin) n=1 Tax=Paraburkholderia caballeronis TaxID=416943 RepID=A0A1H7NVJ2_9BURK|nr:porin [Paraburkholderia caballeronis]PXW25519.1 putative porin [Paraburkholderia caballeronis]PXX01126.1 putative porin [Paraburkholderia caballeronis]RAJ99521.1 putative porin [Paraburkholderia caballeronis]TDV11501.1 putative porin [Paraburkholderia caballeronis]TDV14691.1 putative porin [Paraburkholderia caballeronis]